MSKKCNDVHERRNAEDQSVPKDVLAGKGGTDALVAVVVGGSQYSKDWSTGDGRQIAMAFSRSYVFRERGISLEKGRAMAEELEAPASRGAYEKLDTREGQYGESEYIYRFLLADGTARTEHYTYPLDVGFEKCAAKVCEAARLWASG